MAKQHRHETDWYKLPKSVRADHAVEAMKDSDLSDGVWMAMTISFAGNDCDESDIADALARLPKEHAHGK